MKFKTILADPPWHFKAWSVDKQLADGSRTRAVERHYKTQDSNWIEGLPVKEIADDDCALFLWGCWPMLEDGIRALKAWGFEYKTLAFCWVKTNQDHSPRMGLGYWTRANSEPCLLATRGKPKRLDKGVEQVIISGLGQHSEKPYEQYKRIEQLVEGPYLELFARKHYFGQTYPLPNWTFVGNEIDGKDINDALKELAVL